MSFLRMVGSYLVGLVFALGAIFLAEEVVSLYSLGVATSGGRIWSEEQGTFVELGQSL